MCVPVTVGKAEMVEKAIELLSFYSGDTVVPAYYDIVLGEKLARDADSKEMLEIIYDGIVFDPGVNFTGFSTNMNRLFSVVKYGIIGSGNGHFASWYAAYGSGAQAEIDKFAADAAKLDEKNSTFFRKPLDKSGSL